MAIWKGIYIDWQEDQKGRRMFTKNLFLYSNLCLPFVLIMATPCIYVTAAQGMWQVSFDGSRPATW